MRHIVLTSALLTLFGCSSTPDSVSKYVEKTYDIVVNGEVGDTYSYAMTSDMQAVGADGTMGFTTTFTERLVKVEGDVFEWETTFESVNAYGTGVMAGGDAAFKQMESLVMTSIQDNRGTVRTLRVGDMEIPSKGSANVVLPPRLAKIGDTWKANVDMSGKIFEIEYRLESVEPYQGIQSAKIVGSYKAGDPIKSIEPPVFWVEMANGKMLFGRSVAEATVEGNTIRVTYEVKRS